MLEEAVILFLTLFSKLIRESSQTSNQTRRVSINPFGEDNLRDFPGKALSSYDYLVRREFPKDPKGHQIFETSKQAGQFGVET